MKFAYGVFFTLLFKISITNGSTSDDDLTIWANRIGKGLWELASNLTRHHQLKSDYNQANVTEMDLATIIEEMANRIHIMLERKKDHLHRIVNVMEEGTKSLPDEPNEKMRNEYMFKDAKALNPEDRGKLSRDVNFFNDHVTINFSTVHVPTDVYSRSNETLLGISCSEILDSIFKHNYYTDPTLSWQYFAGASGFMRVYPGIEWVTPEDQADLFDARSRPWYIEAATDPKDIVILVDNSGSMMGQKKKIARHTVNTILETLGPNDFVNIYKFENKTDPVTECFNKSLAQANLVTIRELKFGVEKMSKANALANFEVALETAFSVLQTHREESLASMCNQAIMLITDGVPGSFRNIFQKHNWKNMTEPPFPVRVFTYLIGRDGTDFRETKWMACANQGYYVQLNTIPEVKEQVFNYINVLARPLVLKNVQKIAWTSLYAHRIDPKITDYRWEKQQNDQQKEYTTSYRKDWKEFLKQSAQQERANNWRKITLDQNRYAHEEPEFSFMISISHPAYDQRRTKAEVASLLGVAGTDIPISEFKKIMKPYYLGVNNYGFIVNNNGYIIVHPDHRPFFRGTLKPGYNSVDMLEVELLDNGDGNKEPRDFDIQVHETANGDLEYMLSNLSLLRDLVINQTDNSNQSFQVKFHYDNMKRVATGRRHYRVKKIEESPFTLVLATMKPICNASNCQSYRVVAPNAQRKLFVSGNQVKELFSGNWNVHPEWFYCKYNYNNEHYTGYSDKNLANKTLELLHFLKKMQQDSFWEESKDPYAEVDIESGFMDTRHQADEKNLKNKSNPQVLSYYCDQELVRNLLFDANVTRNIFEHLDDRFKLTPQLNFSEGSIKNVFISTHSGLTRWKDLKNDTFFGYIHNRSIDEIWYKRAVQQYYINKESFVFSVPLEQESTDQLLVTASHAIFVGKDKRKDVFQAPSAVIGFTFLHSDFDRYIQTVVDTSGIYRNIPESVLYFVLDNNGYIIAANNSTHVGKFFGTINPGIMSAFQECHIFRKIVIYDYQGVCFHQQHATNAAFSVAFSTLTNPFTLICSLMSWIVRTFLLGIIRINVDILALGLSPQKPGKLIVDEQDKIVEIEIENFDDEIENTSNEKPKYRRVKHMVVLNRTRPQTCDRGIDLYHLEPEKTWERKMKCANVTSILRLIPHTNLVLVVLPNVTEKAPKVQTNEVMKTDPFRVKVGVSPSPVCYKINAVLSRRRPSSCCKEHKGEKKITLCGRGNFLAVNSMLTSFLLCSQFLV